MNKVEITGIIAGILTSVSFLPQLIKILKEKKVEDLSTGMFMSLLIGLILWVVYGILRSDCRLLLPTAFLYYLTFTSSF